METKDNDVSKEDEYDNEGSEDWQIEMNCSLGELMSSGDYDMVEIRERYFEEIHNSNFESLSSEENEFEIPEEEIDRFVEFLKSSLE